MNKKNSNRVNTRKKKNGRKNENKKVRRRIESKLIVFFLNERMLEG